LGLRRGNIIIIVVGNCYAHENSAQDTHYRSDADATCSSGATCTCTARPFAGSGWGRFGVNTHACREQQRDRKKLCKHGHFFFLPCSWQRFESTMIHNVTKISTIFEEKTSHEY
jgi:hypothetical protein